LRRVPSAVRPSFDTQEPHPTFDDLAASLAGHRRAVRIAFDNNRHDQAIESKVLSGGGRGHAKPSSERADEAECERKRPRLVTRRWSGTAIAQP